MSRFSTYLLKGAGNLLDLMNDIFCALDQNNAIPLSSNVDNETGNCILMVCKAGEIPYKLTIFKCMFYIHVINTI